MMLWSALAMAMREIRRNAMRSVLTGLGIVIGVGAVIAMVHLGDAATRSVTDQIASLGQNLLFVTPGASQHAPGGARAQSQPFKLADANAIASEVAGVSVAPAASSREMVLYAGKNWPTTVTGSTASFLEVRAWSIAAGRAFEASEVRSAAAVCVLGATVVRELFGARPPLGAQIRVRRVACRVIGVLTAPIGFIERDIRTL